MKEDQNTLWLILETKIENIKIKGNILFTLLDSPSIKSIQIFGQMQQAEKSVKSHSDYTFPVLRIDVLGAINLKFKKISSFVIRNIFKGLFRWYALCIQDIIVLTTIFCTPALKEF